MKKLNDYIKRNTLKNSLLKVLDEKKYIRIEPSYFESYDSINEYSKVIDKNKLLKVVDFKGEVQVLRGDTTISILKIITEFYEKNAEYRVYYDSTIFRNNLRNGLEEIREVGAEYYGNNSVESDLEILEIVSEIVSKTKKSVLVIGNNQYINSLLDDLSVDEYQRIEILNFMKKREKTYLKAVLNKVDGKESIKLKIIELIDECSYKDLLLGYQNETMLRVISELGVIKSLLNKKFNIDISIDLSLLGAFDYYKGSVFKAYNKELQKAFLKGGRYLVCSEYSEEEIPAVGFSIDFEELCKIGGSCD